MAQPYIGEVRMFGGSFAPVGWLDCDGQTLPISEYDALFTLIGTTYGGDGQETFNLPNLMGRVPVHQGQGTGLTNRVLGETGGVTDVTLSVQQMPVHSHPQLATAAQGSSGQAQNEVLAQGTNVQLFRSINPSLQMANNVVAPAGGSQPHTNVMPYQVIRFIISIAGIFPSQT